MSWVCDLGPSLNYGRRLAGLASKTASGKGKINNEEFQRELELADEEELPQSRRSGKASQKQVDPYSCSSYNPTNGL